MFRHRMFSPLLFQSLVAAALATSPLAQGATLELLDVQAPDADSAMAFASTHNATAAPVSFIYSNGEVAELGAGAGRLLPCARIQGLKLFVFANGEDTGLSAQLECKHSYTIRPARTGSEQ